LDGQNDRDSKFLFQAATTLTVGIGCHIVLINEARVENVVWAVGTTVTTGANVNFIGSIMAGTAVTFGANTILEGSILALTAVTLGAENQVNGCIVALTAITFGAKNSVSVDVIDFPWLANPYDDLTIVCLPLRDEKDQADAPPACFSSSTDADMQKVLNRCTKKGLANAMNRTGTRRRASRSDVPHVEGHIRMLPAPEGGGRALTSLRGVGQGEERELQRRGRRRVCVTVNPSLLLMRICCYGNRHNYNYCISPSDPRRRRGLVETETDVFEHNTITSTEMEQYLPSISAECSSQFQRLAEDYIATDENATCFAAASDVHHLKCHAILVTGGNVEL
jgi:hypothetical protein